MSKYLKFALFLLTTVSLSEAAFAGKLNLGREATPEEIAAWDIDVRPDGQGLPDGQGSVTKGEEIFSEKCASCHGDFAEGVDRWPELSGGQDSLAGEDPKKTIGSYWPYLSTVFDYINRSMPFGDAQSLEPEEVYAVTAFLLHMNDIVDADFVLSKDNFSSIRMPNENNFIEDSRPDTPMISEQKPCMTDCKPVVEITKRALVLDVTPDEEKNPSAAID